MSNLLTLQKRMSPLASQNGNYARRGLVFQELLPAVKLCAGAAAFDLILWGKDC
jgi:hypothetical protein